VSDESAAFTVLGAIALQGIRLVQPTLGEAVVVTGLGLIGLITAQLLKAHGCRVLGIDFDPSKLQLARQLGCEVVDLSAGHDPVAAGLQFSRGRGVDAVIITAATRSSEPVHQAAVMSRKRGRIVLVGVTGLELSRADFFEKELTFQVSCSYGPGRYDPHYEQKGNDYPVGFVRWTEQRNFEAVLDMLATDRLDVQSLVSHRFPIATAEKAYDLMSSEEPSLGILIEYPGARESATPLVAERTVQVSSAPAAAGQAVTVSLIGSGNYARGVLIPAFKEAGARLRAVASAGGVTSVHSARKFGFEQATTDSNSVIADKGTDAVVVTTRHDTHAAFVLAARAAGKHVFVEKPLCLTLEELARIEAAWGAGSPLLMVGFNRRFAPHIVRMKSLLDAVPGPKAFVMTVNAGAIPAAHWAHDPESGGGRILGESCHFIDLLRHLAGCAIVEHGKAAMSTPTHDSASLALTFADGSIGTVHYLANGSKTFPKERLEVFAAGRVLQLDNFRRLRGFGWPGFRRMHLWRQDKGQEACARAFLEAVRTGGVSPIPLDEILEVSRISIEIAGVQQPPAI
jgi:predicted dehydrogenase